VLAQAPRQRVGAAAVAELVRRHAPHHRRLRRRQRGEVDAGELLGLDGGGARRRGGDRGGGEEEAEGGEEDAGHGIGSPERGGEF
jgi:hypothetical protein